MRSHRRFVITEFPSDRPSTRLVPVLLVAFLAAMGGPTASAAGLPTILPQLMSRPRVNTAKPQLSPTDKLEKLWPGYPEWLAMFVEVASDRAIEARSGWYRKGVTKSRFDWPTTLDRLDRDDDAQISRAEAGVSEADFRRIDRNRDAVLTERDFEFSAFARTGRSEDENYPLNAFASADRDHDARLSKAEWEQMLQASFADPIIRIILANIRDEVDRRFQDAAREGITFLTLSDFQEAFSLSPRPQLLERMVGPVQVPPTRASQQAMVRAFFRGELGSMGAGPALNEPAPDFTLPTADGRSEVTLSKLYPTKPVVLIFGNFTCGPFRNHSGSLELLHRRYGDRAHFLVVYTREAHPSDGWQMEENLKSNVVFNQPRQFNERVEMAQTCQKSLDLDLPMLIDTMDDRVETIYSALPSRLYLVDREGRIAYKGGRGPFGFRPAELEQSLLLLLGSERTTGAR